MPTIDPVSFRVDSKESSFRKVPDESFATVLKTGANAVSGAVINGAAVAGPFVPGAAGVSAALGGAAAVRGAISGATIATGGVPVGTGVAPLDGLGAVTGGSPTEIIEATRKLQESNQMFSMQYLELQEKMQQENRQYSTLSNVLKTRHESAKTAINNIR
ncbi:MAG: hypothetical protein HY897_00260 [Deltaproteobacteria bacterium]|nr:hypothetical protein [Deltaproteobacteria bacterium]